MDKITRIGVDLAKNVMQVHAVDSAGRVVARKAIARERFVSWFANLEPCLVAMEACGAAHYWARKLRALGHDVRLIPPQFVAPYRKGGVHVKNDALDAEATCEAANRPHMRSCQSSHPPSKACWCSNACTQALSKSVPRWSTDCAGCWPSSACLCRKASASYTSTSSTGLRMATMSWQGQRARP